MATTPPHAAATALRGKLTRNETSTAWMRVNRRNGYFAVLLYSMLAVTALWLPLLVAALTTMTWVFWLIHGISIRHEGAVDSRES